MGLTLDLPPIGMTCANPLPVGCESGACYWIDNYLADGSRIGIVLKDWVWIVGLVYDWLIGLGFAEWRGLAKWIGSGGVSDWKWTV